MDKGSLYVREAYKKPSVTTRSNTTARTLTFNLSLQLLRDIVRDSERSGLVHDNVNFHVVPLASMVRSALLTVRQFPHSWQCTSYSVDLKNPSVMGHGHVNQLGDKFPWRRLSDK